MCTMFFSCQPVFEGPYYIWPQMMVPVHVIAQGLTVSV